MCVEKDHKRRDEAIHSCERLARIGSRFEVSKRRVIDVAVVVEYIFLPRSLILGNVMIEKEKEGLFV